MKNQICRTVTNFISPLSRIQNTKWDYLRRPLTKWELDPFFHPASICALGGKYLSPEFESDQFRLSTANVCGEIRKIGEKCSPAIGCLRHFCTTIIPSHLPSTTSCTCKVPLNWNQQLLIPFINSNNHNLIQIDVSSENHIIPISSNISCPPWTPTLASFTKCSYIDFHQWVWWRNYQNQEL